MNTPFDLVFDALWTLAEQSDKITSSVKIGNRIKFNLPTNRDPIKARVQVGDLPELVLSTEGTLDVNLNKTSCAAMISRQYSWLISTGDFRVNFLLFPVQWALFCAMMDWDTVLTQLTWQGSQFVKKCQVLALTEGLSNKELNRGIMGWSCLWRCQVDMYFSQQDMRNYNTSSLLTAEKEQNHAVRSNIG